MPVCQKGFLKVWLVVLVIVLVAFLGYLALANKFFNPAQQTSVTYPEGKTFVPAGAKFVSELRLDFENDGIDELAVVYSANVTNSLQADAGLLILAHQPSNEWKIVYSQPPVNGAGTQISVDSIKAPDNTRGLFILESFYGAGSSKDWYIITKEMKKLDRRPLLDQALESKEDIFLGYNDAKVINNMVVETVSGYSKTAAQCCPDKPSLEITYKFMGTAIEFISVTEQRKP